MGGGTASAVNSAAGAGFAFAGAPTRLLIAWVMVVAIFCGRDVLVAQIRRLQAREVAGLGVPESN